MAAPAAAEAGAQVALRPVPLRPVALRPVALGPVRRRCPAYQAGSLEGVPQHGVERMEQLKGGLFTSDLSVNEFLLIKEAGFEPLGLVVGSSIYHIGFQQSAWSQNQEMAVLSQAMYHARELAMTRMEEEADQLGADGIVGVRLDIGQYEWGSHMAEFIAIGTAVKHREGALHRAPNGRPFTSDLSGQEFWTLLRAGYRPVGLTMGSCVYHVAHQGLRQMFKQVGPERRAAELHPGAVRRARAGDGAHAGRGPGRAGGGHRRCPAQRALARLGLARDRVLRDRDRESSRRPRTTRSPAPQTVIDLNL